MSIASTPTQWDYLREAIFKEFPALKPSEENSTVFQFSGTPSEAIWGSGQGNIGFTMANSSPSGIGNYYFQSSFSIYKSYQNYLEAIDGDNNTLERAKNEAFNDAYYMTFIEGNVTSNVPWSSIASITAALTKWTSAGPDAPPELNVTMTGADSIKTFLPSETTSLLVGKQPEKTSALQRIIEDERTRNNTIYKVQIQAIGAQSFNVSRKDWFDASWLSASNIKLTQNSFFTLDDFFDDNGTLVLIPISFLAIYKPKVIITLPNEAAEGLDLTADTITVFGLDFPNSAIDSKISSHNNKATVITLDSYADANANPMIFGVNSQLFLRDTTQQQKSGSITIENSGVYVATFSVEYNQSGTTQTINSGDFQIANTKNIQLPADATNIIVRVKIATFIKTWSDVATYNFEAPVVKSYELTGTTLSPKIHEV